MANTSSDSSDDEDYLHFTQTSLRDYNYDNRDYFKDLDQEIDSDSKEFERKRYRDYLESDISLRERPFEQKKTNEKTGKKDALVGDISPSVKSHIRGQNLNALMEREIGLKFENKKSEDKRETRNKPNKYNEFSEQKYLSGIDKMSKKQRKKAEHENLLKEYMKSKNEIMEMKKHMARISGEFNQKNMLFNEAKLANVNKMKQNQTLDDKRSLFQNRSNKQMNKSSDLFDYSLYKPEKKKANKPKIDFGRASGGEYQILLLGGTGAGKSTMINTMANYFLGGSLKNPKVVIPTKYFNFTESGYGSNHSESALEDVTKSKTTKCLTYTFTHPNNRCLKFVFIDSPGLSDTGGTKQDDKNIDEIINTVIIAGSLSAIIVIANGTEPRITPSIENTLVRLGNNLPDELIDNNLLLVLTKCSRISASFSVDEFARMISRPREVFYMDNQAFCSDPKIWKMDSDAYEALMFNWKQSQKTFDNLLKSITGMSNTSTDSFKSMRDLRNKLKSEIATICQDISNIQKVQDSLENAQIEAQRTGYKKDEFSNYTKSETITLKKIVEADYHSTVCTTHLLQDIICHQKCGLDLTKEGGNFSTCCCFAGTQTCTVCQCGPQSHFHDMVKLETTTETVDKVIEDIKAQYDAAFADYEKLTADKATFESTLKELQTAVDQKYLKIHQLCYDLSKICSRFNFVDELHANIKNMQLEARTIKNDDIRKNAEFEIDKLNKLVNDLSSKQRLQKGSYSVAGNSNFQSQSAYDSRNSNKWTNKLYSTFFK